MSQNIDIFFKNYSYFFDLFKFVQYKNCTCVPYNIPRKDMIGE